MSIDMFGALRSCIKGLKLKSLNQTPVHHACRWLSGTYPESPSPTGITITANNDMALNGQDDLETCKTTVPEEDIQHAQVIWDYMLMKQPLVKSDVLLVLGNHDLRVASYAAFLWLAGYADWLMFTGLLGNFTKGKWTRPEAEVFRDIALNMGVPEDRILMETKATNTGENIRFSYEVLRKLQLNPKKVTLVQMPFMERRIYATFMKQWPGDTSKLCVQVTSPVISLVNYPNEQVGTMQEIISMLIGCLQRISVYPKTGFQIPQNIPEEVWAAYKVLQVNESYNSYLLSKKHTSETPC